MKLASELDIKKLHKLIKENGQYFIKKNKQSFNMKSLKQINSIKYKD